MENELTIRDLTEEDYDTICGGGDGGDGKR